jgi:phosphohistidine phosphatase SixA
MRAMSEMVELEVIAETLKRQRRDLEDLIDSTSSRSGETAELVTKIENLRRRSEETQRRFQAIAESNPKEKT